MPHPVGAAFSRGARGVCVSESERRKTPLERWETDDATELFNRDEQALEKLDCGWAKAAHFFRTGDRFGHQPRSVKMRSLVNVHSELEHRKREYESGESLALLHAVLLCASENLPLPTWLAEAYTAAFKTFIDIDGSSRSLDEAFSSRSLPTKTPSSNATAKQDWKLGVQLWGAVRAIAKDHSGLDPAITEVLKARPWGVGKTKAKALVKMIDESQSGLTGGKIRPLSQVWGVPRKR